MERNEKQDYILTSVSTKALNMMIEKNDDTLVYFYSPECDHCKRMTPLLIELQEDLGIQIKYYDVLKYQKGWDKYNITGTPTIIRFNKGEEINRIIGERGKRELESWILSQ